MGVLDAVRQVFGSSVVAADDVEMITRPRGDGDELERDGARVVVPYRAHEILTVKVA